MAETRKAAPRKAPRKPKAVAETGETVTGRVAESGPETAPERPAEQRRRTPNNADQRRSNLERTDTEPETSQEAITRIAQDAVVILRRELAFRAELSLADPGSVSMTDCIALLRLTTELGAAAMRGADGDVLRANYDRLSPSERVQLAALQMKVDYS